MLPREPAGLLRGDEGVPWRRARALADAVGRQGGADPQGGTPGREQAGAGERGEGVSGSGDELVAAPAVGRVPAEEPDECGDSVVEPVEEAELERVEAQSEDEAERQHRRDHLRDVRDEADGTEGEYGGGDAAARR